MHVSARSLPALAAGAVLLLATPSPAAEASKHGAQVAITMKDGFVIQGMDRREGKDEYVDGIFIFIPSGFFEIDDMARRQYFSAELMQKIDQKEKASDDKIYGKQYAVAIAPGAKPAPPVDEVLSTGAWNAKWDRSVKFRSLGRDYTVNQHLVTLTPYYALTYATDHWSWPAMYLTRELGPSSVRDLLSSHPDFDLGPTVAPAERVARHFRYCDFFAQAGWYDESERELDRMLAENPPADVKEKAEARRALYGQMRTIDDFETIKLRHNAGQFKAVRKALADFNDKAANAPVLARVNALRDTYQAGDKALADAARFLDELPRHLVGGKYDALLAEAAADIKGELQLDNIARLDAFLGQASQAERQATNCKAPAAGSAELLSFAVTGWLGALPEGSPETAAKLWGARRFVQKYLAADGAARKTLLAEYLSNPKAAAGVDDFTKLIPLLPAPAPEEKAGDEPIEMKAGAGRNAISYLLQLPPEYRPSRNYPVLFLLHDMGEQPKDQIDRWREAAADNGYILVAPEWSAAGGPYGYGEDEHAAVLQTLRDLRGRLAVDSDRVFLFGLGQGGAMAFDVGLSHPDLFAGVLPMSAGPAKFSKRYYTNAQNLPFYIVDGEPSPTHPTAMNKDLRELFGEWATKYQAIWIQYKGRGQEWYGAEVPTMFDWMRGQRRQFPMKDLGTGRPFATLRAGDNSFYWATTNGVQDRHINSGAAWNPAVTSATLHGKIDLENNTIALATDGLSQVTVWLGRNAKGEPMVNFEKPVTVTWDAKTVWNKQVVTPSLATLLEDLADRGDRQRLFVAKLEFRK